MDQEKDEGCMLDGFIRVSKVKGSFHFAPGASFEIQGIHAHDLSEYQKHKGTWDFSHIIHSLSFGESPTFSNPLDGTVKESKNRYLTLT